MKRRNHLPKSNGIGLPSSLFIDVLMAPNLRRTHRYVVRTDVDDAGNSTVLATGVTDPQKRGPGVADRNVGFATSQ
jgi:hypothetical protein